MSIETLEPKLPEAIPIQQRVLTEVDHINASIATHGILNPADEHDILVNLRTAVQEAGMPHAVARTQHEYVYDHAKRRASLMWLGQTAVEAAMSGYLFHRHEAARERVAVEVDEAHHSEEDLRPGVMKVLISPKMSEKDADREVAESEHLAEDDAVRVSWLETDDKGNITHRELESLLVKDVPLAAWVAFLNDPQNIFGKSIVVDDPESALSVMKTHRELEVPVDALPEGPISLVEMVLPHIEDENLRSSVQKQLELFRCDQEELERIATGVAERWLEFEKSLAESLRDGRTNLAIESYIHTMQHHWNDEGLALIEQHHIGGGRYAMTRELAAMLENARRQNLWTTAGVRAGNQAVIEQLSPEAYNRILQNEQLIEVGRFNGMDVYALEMQNNRIAAAHNVNVGGGCPGKTKDVFKESESDALNNLEIKIPGLEIDGLEAKDEIRWKPGVCRIDKCPTRPGKTEVGPCSICKGCQAHFEKGKDPAKEYSKTQVSVKPAQAKQKQFTLAA